MRRFRGDRRGATVQIGAILLFGIVVLSLAAYQATAVPADNERIEFNHNQQLQQDVLDLRNALLRGGTAGGSQSVSVELGTTYPSRVLFVNPPPPSGRLATGPPRSLAVRNVSATSAETDDYLNASANGAYTLETRSLTYRPGYNVYDAAPVTTVQTGTVVNEFPAGNDTAITGQTLVRDNEIYLLAVEGDLSTAQPGTVTVDPQALSRTQTATTVTGDGSGNVTLVVPTSLSADRWRTLLGDEYDPGFDGDGHVYRVSEVPGRPAVELALDGGQTYRLRTALVGVGDTGPAPGPAYLTRVEGDEGDVTVEVRDRYNNPVPDSRVTGDLAVRVTGGQSVLGPTAVPVGEDGRASFEYSGTTGTATLTLQRGGSAALDATNGTVDVEVTQADVPGQSPVVAEDADIVGGPGGGGGGTVSGSEVDLTFRNTDADRGWNVTAARFDFYDVDAGQSANTPDEPGSLTFEGATLTAVNEGGTYEPVSPKVEIPAGSSRTVTLEFYQGTTGSGASFDVRKGDFLVLSVVFENGDRETYFVAPS